MIELKGIKYEATKMAPRVQQHVLRRLSPMLSMVGATLLGLLDESKDKGAVMLEVAASIGPLTDALSKMDDATVNYVLDACLLHINRLDGEKWCPLYIRTSNGAQSMYQDVDGGMEMRLVMEALKINVEGFFGQLSEGTASSLSATKAEADRTT